MTDSSTGTNAQNAKSGPGKSLPGSVSGSSATTNVASIAPPKPRGFFNKVLHGIGKGLKTAGEVAIAVALGVAASRE